MKIFNETQKQGIDIKLKAFDTHDITDDRWRAYMLATSFHETAATMQPIEERGKGAGKPYGQKRKYNSTVYVEPNKLFFGRGDVQLTWYENYEMMGRLLDIPLLNKPELALVPEISARIMIEGMTRGMSNRGDFTGVSLENYFNANREDPFNARRIINGLDCAKLIEGYYWMFLSALRNSGLILFYCMISIMFVLVGCKPKQLVNEHVVTKTNSTEAWELTDSLQIEEGHLSTYNNVLKWFIVDNLSYVSDMSVRAIYYDTRAQIDSTSGRHPILSEVFTTNTITVDKAKRDSLSLTHVDNIEKTSFTSINSNTGLKIDKLSDENKYAETKSFTESRMKYILILICVIIFIVIIIKR